jgi:hypothetical protein
MQYQDGINCGKLQINFSSLDFVVRRLPDSIKMQYLQGNFIGPAMPADPHNLEYGVEPRRRTSIVRGILIGNICAIAASSTLFFAPYGSNIRPMALTLLLMLICVVSGLLSAANAIAELVGNWRQPRQWLRCLGLCLFSLTPILSSVIACGIITFVWKLHWEG